MVQAFLEASFKSSLQKWFIQLAQNLEIDLMDK